MFDLGGVSHESFRDALREVAVMHCTLIAVLVEKGIITHEELDQHKLAVSSAV